MAAIRPATPADAESIRKVALASWHTAYDDLLGTETVEVKIAEWYALDELRRVVDQPSHVFRVAEADDVVGFVHIGPNPNDERVAELFRIYVRPERWGEEIGRQLLDSAQAKVTGFDRLALSVFADNEVGVGFYEKRGFERIGAETVEIGGGAYREYRYEKTL